MKDKPKRSDLMKQMRERKAAGRKNPPLTVNRLRKLIDKVKPQAIKPKAIAQPDAKVAMIKVLISMPVKLAKQLRQRADVMEITQSELVCRFLRRRKQPGAGVRIDLPKETLPVIVKGKDGRLKSVARERELLS